MKNSKKPGSGIKQTKNGQKLQNKYQRDKMYVCPFCPKECEGKDNRRRHIFSMHKEELLNEFGGTRAKRN